MGYGTLSDQSIAAYLQKSLRETNQRTTVVNLAKNRDYSVLRLQANYLLFEHLEIDCIVFLLTAHQSTVDLGLARPDLAAGINYAKSGRILPVDYSAYQKNTGGGLPTYGQRDPSRRPSWRMSEMRTAAITVSRNR